MKTKEDIEEKIKELEANVAYWESKPKSPMLKMQISVNSDILTILKWVLNKEAKK